MTMLGAVVNVLIAFVGGALLRMMWIRLWPPGKSAQSLGYAPGSESPPGGWLWPIVGAVAVAVVIFAGLFGYVGSAVFQ